MESKKNAQPEGLSLWLRYLWRLAMPFWLFRDARSGTVEQRRANYNFNRSRRHFLPFYIAKWIGIALCLLQMTQLLSYLMNLTVAQSFNHLCAALFCMSTGIGFAFACVVIAVISASYLFLTYVHD